MADVLEYSRSDQSGLFGKCDTPRTIHLSTETDHELQRIAAVARVPVGEYVRSLIEAHVFGVAEVVTRSSARNLPITSIGKEAV
jgi:hypothetical protein